MKVLTYNLQCDSDNYLDKLVEVVAFLKGEDADIIALQEVRIDAYDFIITQLESIYKHVTDWQMRYNRVYGELLLVKSNIVQAWYASFVDCPNQRALSLYQLDDCYVGTTHLDIARCQRQSDTIVSMLNTCQKLILLGDFNSNIETTLDTTFNCVDSQNTLDQSRPDRIYIRGFA